jgi:CheY-like chemotaxis protein
MTAFRILLVDDDPNVLELTGALLAKAGYAVATATAAADAFARLAAGERFDVLVTDQSMPSMTGEELILHVRAAWPGLPCLLLTGHADAFESRIDVPVLGKPFRASQLAAALAELVASG